MNLSISNIEKAKKEGSLAIAKTVLVDFGKYISRVKANNTEQFFKEINNKKEKLFHSFKAQPLMKNAINFSLSVSKRKDTKEIKTEITNRMKFSLNYVNTTYQRLADFGYNKIKQGMVVYTHNYSAAVLNLLAKSKQHKINFEVHLTETRPTLGGRRMAKALIDSGIPVTYYTDAAMRQALKKADIVIIGADTISDSGQVYSAIGSELIAELAEKYDVPVYVCMPSWKYNPSTLDEYEESAALQQKEEIWSNPPKGVIISNFGYEKIHPKLVTGIITELGIYKPHYLISEIRRQYSWIK
jgi:translation initiation factor 2B subunit (eIF-2B alpha/beta/delta family)